MSQIIRELKCSKCQKEYKDLYISFGHPDEDFDWKWKCDECGEVNTLIIKALPFTTFGIVNKKWME